MSALELDGILHRAAHLALQHGSHEEEECHPYGNREGGKHGAGFVAPDIPKRQFECLRHRIFLFQT